MRENGDWDGGGRVLRFRDSRAEQDWSDGAHDEGDEVKWHDLGNPEVADMLGVNGEQWGHITDDLAGGQHDLVWILYEQLRRSFSYDLEQHREAMTRRGRRLPPELAFVKADAERIICGLHDAGISNVEIGRVFTCDPKTITRTVKRQTDLNVQRFPYGGKEISVLEATPQILARLDAQDRQLNRIEQTLGRLAWQLLETTGSPTIATDAIVGLFASAYRPLAA